MTYTSEIEKLERRWAENPKGRNFAPLADAYRKAGEIDRALELCQNGLARHPDYVSAHIVYGRCLIDQRNDPGAEEVFRKVLGLDPENIIALRVLAEISERQHRFEEAVIWLGKLLAADPMNGDAAEALARAKGKVAATAPLTKPDFVIERASPVDVAATIEAARASKEVETFDGSLDFNSVAHEAAKAEGLEVQEEVELKADLLEVEGLAATQFEAGNIVKPEDESLPSVELPLIMPDDVGAAPAAPRWTPPPPPQPPAPPPPPPPPPRVSAPIPAAVVLSDDDGAADTATLSQVEPVVTETMAELYLKQGHQEDALRVYEALLAQRPHDGHLRQKVAALSGWGAGGTGGEGSGGSAYRSAASGVSVRAFLRGILAGRGGGEGMAAPGVGDSTLAWAFAETPVEPGLATDTAPGAPSHPAEDTISLDAVFGDDARPSPPEHETPAPPAATAPAEPAASGGGFSFDDFFGGAGGAGGAGGSGAPGDTAPKAAARSSGRGSKPAESEGELDQFQSWLKRLKS